MIIDDFSKPKLVVSESSYGRRNKAGFEMDVEDWYIVKDDGKMYKVSIFPTQRKAAKEHGYSPTREEAKRKAGSQGVAEGSLAEMDKSASQPGRDGKVSHKTYGSRDNYKLGDPERTGKQISAEKAKKDALDILKKQGVAEGSEQDDPYKGITPGNGRSAARNAHRLGKTYKNPHNPKYHKAAHTEWEKEYNNEIARLKKKSVAEGLTDGAQDLHIGDPVIITGSRNEFEGATGEIVDFGRDNRFVVVDLYNHGRHSFHSSDVSFNEYAGSDDEEARMYDAGEFGDDARDGMDEARMSAAQRLSTAWDKQRAKSDASLRRTPSSIPKAVDKERMIRDIATSDASPEHKKVAIDAVMKTMSESRAQRQQLLAQMLNSR